MADLIGPFDSVPWSQSQWFRFAPMWAQSAIVGTPASAVGTGSFGATASGLNVTVATGRAWMRGAGYEPDTAKVLAVTANTNVSLSRRDRIVIRRDLAAQTETVERLTGTASGTPTAPALTQSETGVWEIPVCSFLAPPNSGTTLSGFVDERAWIDSSGRVSVYDSNGLEGLAAQPDISHGFKAYMSSTKRDYRWDGTAWKYAGGAPPPIVACTDGAGWGLAAGRVPGVFWDSDGMVNLVGAMTPDSAYNPQDGGVHTALQLPTGFFPTSRVDLLITVPSQGLIVSGKIDTAGLLSIVSGSSATTIAAGSPHILDGLRFHPGYTGTLPLA